MERIPKNVAECKCWEQLEAKGWQVSKRGWPDFFCWKEGEIALIEIKPHRGRKLKASQHRVMSELAKRGIPCYRWTPDNGFDKLQCDL